MKRPGIYPSPRYNDPHDKRLVRIIRHSQRSEPRAVNIVGVPFDGAVLGKRGAAEGPSAIRQALGGFSNFAVELGVGLEGSRIVDLGDLVVGAEDVLKAHNAVEKEVGLDLKDGSLLVILGGDNSISLPALTAFAKKFGEIGLVVVDSHFDLRERIGGRPTSGSSYGLAIESLPGLDPRRVAEIGVHGFLNSLDYYRKARKLGVSLFTADDVRRSGAETVAMEAYAVASKGAKAVYVSVDLDAVDLSWVSGVSAPSAGGITADELFRIVHTLTKRKLVGCLDLVELAPGLDPSGRSQVVAATALTYAFAGFRGKGKGGRRPRVTE